MKTYIFFLFIPSDFIEQGFTTKDFGRSNGITLWWPFFQQYTYTGLRNKVIVCIRYYVFLFERNEERKFLKVLTDALPIPEF